MNKGIFLLILGALVFACSGCVHKRQAPMYYFGNSASLNYASKKEPTEENFQNLKHSIEEIIEHSGEKGIKVPPGVFANLGYLNLLENNSNMAVKLFNNEKQLYPESSIFMDRMINKVEAKIRDVEEGEKDA